MKKSVDGYDALSSDNPPDEVNFTIKYSPLDLIELLEQRLENEPKGVVSHKQWRKDVNRMIDELESVYDIKTWKKV